MPTVTLNRNVFEKVVGKKLPINELKDRISMLGTDLEDVTQKEIVVEVFPNRPDMLSEQGFARAFSSFLGINTGLSTYSVKRSGLKVIVDKSITMRPFTACAIVKNLKLNDDCIRELMQIQEKLATTHGRRRKKSAYGIYPLEKINFPITYVAKDPQSVEFAPLGYGEKMNGLRVEETHHTGKEFSPITDGWKKYPFFIDNDGAVLSMLPYTNSNDVGKVDTSTTEVFVECTGTSLENVNVALKILTTTLADMGGDIYAVDVEYPENTITTPNLEPQKMDLDIAYVESVLGLGLNQKQVSELLEKMGYGYKNKQVLIPAWRADILHPIDLIEDIAIAYGYENVEEEIPHVATIGEENPLARFASQLTDVMVGAGYQEVKNYHLMSLDELQSKMTNKQPAIDLLNAPADYDHLRNSIIPSLLKTLTQNQHRDYPQNLFEIGTVFLNDTDAEYSIDEKQFLAITLCDERADFTAIRQIIDTLTQLLELEITVQEVSHPSMIEGRSAAAYVGKTKIATFGELSPLV